MKILLLDEGVPEPLKYLLSDYEVHSVDSLGWKGTKNGRLLKLVESAGAAVFITSDKSIQRQQDLIERPFATLTLSTNSWVLIRAHIDAIREALLGSQPGVVVEVDCGTFVPRRFRRQEG